MVVGSTNYKNATNIDRNDDLVLTIKDNTIYELSEFGERGGVIKPILKCEYV